MSYPQLFNRLSKRSVQYLLQDSVTHDVERLLNCSLRGARLEGVAEAHVASSVLNFGCPALIVPGLNRVDPQQIAVNIRRVLCEFEPRLKASDTVVLVRDDASVAGKRYLHFDIQSILLPILRGITIRLQLDYQGALFTCRQVASTT